jgi:DNA-binding MarR family transcriptional regulator
MPDRVYRFILEFEQRHGFAPTLKEIGSALYLSRSGVYGIVRGLEADGRLQRTDAPYRNFRPVEMVTP